MKLLIKSLIVLLLLSVTTFSLAQNNNELVIDKDLKLLTNNIIELKKNIDLKKKDLQKVNSVEKKEEINLELETYESRLVKLETSFVELISNTNINDFGNQKEIEFSWENEISTLLEPIFNKLKDFTDEPRKLEKLKNETEMLVEKQKQLKQIISSFDITLKENNNKAVSSYIDKIYTNWTKKLENIQTDLLINQQQIQLMKKQKKSFVESAEGIFDIFFKSRGINLLIAIAAVGLYWVFIFYFYKFTLRMIKKYDYQNYRFTLKISQIVYTLALILGIFIIFVLALYFLNDWLLLIISLFLIIGILWSTKEAFPRYWSQAILLINSGPVRENEMVFYNGLPYKVRNIHFYSILSNSELEGGIIKLPLNDLLSLRSRKYTNNETWFPTKKNDWILVKDLNLFGKVISQTPNNTVIEKKGNSIIQIPSAKFYEMMPVNLSNGYRIQVVFGIDYKHQNDLRNNIIDIFNTEIKDNLKSYINEKFINNINVNISTASASSIDLSIIVDFSGAQAGQYYENQRIINCLCIDICNKHNFLIPFNQLSLHIESNKSLK